METPVTAELRVRHHDPLYDETRCHAERHIGPAGMKVVVWCDKDTGHKGQHRNEQQGIYWSGNDA